MPGKGDHRLLEQLLMYWEAFGHREKRVIQLIARRLYWGQSTFGQLSYGKKDWGKEAFQEVADASIYSACAMVDHEDDSIEDR